MDFEAQYPGADLAAVRLFASLHELVDMLERRVAIVAAEHDVPSFAAVNLMEILHRADGPVAPTDIASLMFVSPGSVTQVLATLQARGLIRRVADSDDRRRRLATLTPKGRRRFAKLFPKLLVAQRHLLDGLPAADRARIARSLAHIKTRAVLDRTWDG